MASKELMIRIARMHFQDGKNKTDIAAELIAEKTMKGSRVADKVADILKEAGRLLLEEHERLTDFQFKVRADDALGAQLCERFGLLAARVVPGGIVRNATDYVALLKRYARAGADYFEELYESFERSGTAMHISVSGGQPILDTVSALIDRPRELAEFYSASLIGRGRLTLAPHVASETNATMAWAKSGRFAGKLHYGTVPPYQRLKELDSLSSRDERHEHGRRSILKQQQELASLPYVKNVLHDIRANVNVAFAGLGIPHADGSDEDYGVEHVERLTMTGQLRPFGIDPQLLKSEGAIGDLAYCLFDQKGVEREEWRFFVTAGEGSHHPGIEFYRHMVERGRHVIVTAGARKHEALKVALHLKMLNILITDEQTAKLLLNQPS